MQFRPLSLFRTSLDVGCCVWRMPKSHTLVPVLNVSGVLAPGKDLLVIAYRAELFFQPFTHEALVIDLGKLEADDATKAELVELAGKFYNNVFCVNGGGEGKCSAHASVQQALYAVLTTLRKKRFDGGKVLPGPESVDYSFGEIPGENYAIQLGHAEALYKDKRLLLITVTGRYPVGSLGSEDGRLLQLQLDYAFRMVRPDLLLVDMTTLDYTWGDEWTYAPFDVQKDKAFPFRLIISEEQEKHMLPLMGKEGRISRTINEALAELA